jgi:hypothetical protein
MSLDATNVRVAVTGAVYLAPSGTAAPTDATTAPSASFNDLGYVGEDGVTETRERSSEKIKAWQGSATVREVVTESSLTYTFVLIETKKETVELFYGSEVDANGMVAIVPSETGGRHALVIDVIDGEDFIRTTIDDGEVTEVGDQVYAAGEPIGYEVTVTAYPDGNGVAARKHYSALDTTP